MRTLGISLLSAIPLLAGLSADPAHLALPNAKVSVQNAYTAATRIVSSSRQGGFNPPIRIAL